MLPAAAYPGIQFLCGVAAHAKTEARLRFPPAFSRENLNHAAQGFGAIQT